MGNKGNRENTSSPPFKQYAYQDGVYRSNPKPSPECTPKVFGVFLLLFLLFITLVSIGFVYVHFPEQKETVFSKEIEPLPCIINKTVGYTLLSEDSLISPDYKYFFYAGRLSFSRAQHICSNLVGGGNLLTIQSYDQEKELDKRIGELSEKLFVNSNFVFTGLRQHLWTGGYVDLETTGINIIRWLDDSGLVEYHQNFCDPQQAVKILKESQAEYEKNGAVINPLVYVVKDYRAYKRNSKDIGCWQLYSSLFYETEHLEFNFVCQVSKSRLPYKFTRKFLGKFRPDENKGLVANEYAAFSGHSSYEVAQETCQKFMPGTQLLTTKTLARDFEVNKVIENLSSEIFGEDDESYKGKRLIWTGGYFNLSSEQPTKVRWADDPNATLDIKEIKYFGSSNVKSEYENFCGTIEYYYEMIDNALLEERDAAKTSGCIKGRLFLIVKDFREGQSVQGCWHVYDLDYLSRHEYKLNLVCQLPLSVKKTEQNYKESEKIFSYALGSKEP